MATASKSAPRPMAAPSVARDADQFEIKLKAANIPSQMHSGLWDVWVQNPTRAAHLVKRFASGITYKAGDDIEEALDRLRDAVNAAAGQAQPVDKIVQMIDVLTKHIESTAKAPEPPRAGQSEQPNGYGNPALKEIFGPLMRGTK